MKTSVKNDKNKVVELFVLSISRQVARRDNSFNDVWRFSLIFYKCFTICVNCSSIFAYFYRYITSKNIWNIIKKLNNGSLQVGNLEIQKASLLNHINLVQQDLANFQNGLKEKYGDVKVNMQTGKFESNIEE